MLKPMSDHCNGCPLWGKANCNECCYIQDIPGVWRRINNVYGDEPIEDLKIYASRAEYFQEELKVIQNYERRLKDEVLKKIQFSKDKAEYDAYLEMLRLIERAAYETGKEYTG